MRPGKGRRALRVRELGTDRCPRALEEVLRGTEDAGGTLGDRLADPVAEDDYERVSAPDRNRVRALLKALDARERTIVKARLWPRRPRAHPAPIGRDARRECRARAPSRAGRSRQAPRGGPRQLG